MRRIERGGGENQKGKKHRDIVGVSGFNVPCRVVAADKHDEIWICFIQDIIQHLQTGGSNETRVRLMYDSLSFVSDT